MKWKLRDVFLTVFVFFSFLPLQYIHFLEHREDEGRRNDLRHKACTVPALFFRRALPDVGFRRRPPSQRVSSSATSLYSVACFLVLLRFESAGRARAAVRSVSMMFRALPQCWRQPFPLDESACRLQIFADAGCAERFLIFKV